MKLFLMTIATAASAALVVPTVAEAKSAGAYEEATASVRFGDLDLSAAGSRATLDRRIDAALEQVCGNPMDPMMAVAAHARACIAEGKAKAARDVQLAARTKGASQAVLAAR